VEDDRLEIALAELLGPTVTAQVGRDHGVDLATMDGKEVFEIKRAVHGTRDLDAAAMHLATYVAHARQVDSAYLVLVAPRMTGRRLEDQWKSLSRALAPSVYKRLRLIALAADADVVLPEKDVRSRQILALVRQAAQETNPAPQGVTPPPLWTAKSFQIWMVLLNAWLRREGPLPVGEVSRRAGASAPTATEALRRFHERGDVERARGRAVALARLSRRTLEEVLARVEELRALRRFVDASGRRDAADLARRIRSKAPRTVALGGVVAARHHVQAFDVDGLPRVDVAVSAHDSLSWLQRVDPALRRATLSDPAPVLVVSRIARADPGFDQGGKGDMPFAGPAETLLDLHDLRLTAQADAFVRELRSERA
jgi:hypothetical protein